MAGLRILLGVGFKKSNYFCNWQFLTGFCLCIYGIFTCCIGFLDEFDYAITIAGAKRCHIYGAKVPAGARKEFWTLLIV
jgi:hypothetical protein